MSDPSPRVQIPAAVAEGTIFSVKTLITHPMETGLRRDDTGRIIPRKIIHKFTCRDGNTVLFTVDLHEACAANPYIEFSLRATSSGDLEFIWEEDGGAVYALKHHLTVG